MPPYPETMPGPGRLRRRSVPTRLLGAPLGALLACAAAAQSEPLHWAPLATAPMRVVVADNAPITVAPWLSPMQVHPHLGGMNGLAYLGHGALEASVLVPWLSGLNFEHVFSGDQASYAWPRVAPRLAPMQLRVVSLNQRIDLVQPSATPWPLATTITFKQRAAAALDFEVSCLPMQDVFAKYGYAGVFFATYLYLPDDLAMHFIGRSRPGQGSATPRWIRHVPPQHGVEANHRPAGSTWDPPFDPGFPIELAAAPSPYEYLYPFFYGRARGGKVLIFMFRPSATGELRFAQSPNGGGPGNPAWDFFYCERQYVVGRPFGVRGSLVVKDFVDDEDVIRAYEAWSGAHVVRPGP